MNIKAIAFSAQQRVAEQLGISLPRSHVYESLAAAFGFASYASLCVDSAFDVGPPGRLDRTRLIENVAQRLAQLGLSDLLSRQVASELTAVVSDQGLRAVSFDHVIDSFSRVDHWRPVGNKIEEDLEEESVEDHDDDPVESWEVSSFLYSGLEQAAKRGNPKAHYALSLILKTEEDMPVGSSYWHDRQLQGDQLSGVQLEWASEHRSAAEQEGARLRHLREAARRGHPDACVDAAEEFADPAFLSIIGKAVVRDPLRATEVAAELGQLDQDQAVAWCAMAAQGGDIEAVRQMIEVYDRGDLLRCWTWLYFAQLLGTDLTRDHYSLVNEDGSEYDDDVGGPGYPVGSEGIELPDLDEHQDAHARRLAGALAECVRISKREPERAIPARRK